MTGYHMLSGTHTGRRAAEEHRWYPITISLTPTHLPPSNQDSQDTILSVSTILHPNLEQSLELHQNLLH